MISIAKLLNGKQTPVPEAPSESNPPSENSPVRFLQPLLHGVARSVVETDPDQLAGFLETFDRIEHELENAASSSEILTKVSEAVLAVEEYNRRASVASQSYRNELHNILSLLMETASFFASSSGVGVENLSSIERSLTSASTASDLKLIRNKLQGCLTLVRTETVRLKLESERMVTSLRAAVVKASAQLLPCIAGTIPDAVTGLPGPEATRELIERANSEGSDVAVVLFVLDQIMALNRGSGRRAGDEVLSFSARHLGTELALFGPLFRWNGPALVLIANLGKQSFSHLESAVKELAQRRLQHVIKTERGDVHFTITYSWTVGRLDGSEPAEVVCGKLDRFVTSQTGWIS